MTTMTDILFMSALAFSTVMVAMLLLSGLCEAMRRLGAAATSRAASEETESAAIEPATLAVIAAAVTEAIGRPVHIHRIRTDRGAADRWSRAGRMDVMISHRVGPTR
jgi:hypothetical protein